MKNTVHNTSEKQLLTIDHSIMQTIGKFGHITIVGLCELMPEKRPKNIIYQRTKVLSEYGYLEVIIDKRKHKIFRLSQRGIDELAMINVSLRGRSHLQSDLARVSWAIDQTGFIETLGLEAQFTTKMLDAVNKGDTPKALIVDNPHLHSANTIQRVEDFLKVTSLDAPLDIVTLYKNRADELYRYLNSNSYGFTVLLSPLDI
jgi:hypothetical protein